MYGIIYHNHPAGLEMGRVKTAFSCDWQEVNHAFRSVSSCFYVVHEGQFYCDLEFSLGFTVYSWHVGVRKGSFWEVSVPKTSAAAIFPVISTSSLSTHLFSPTGLFQLHLHDVCAHVQVNVPWRNIMGARKYMNVIAPPHPTPPQGTYKKMPKTLGRFSTRRHNHIWYIMIWIYSIIYHHLPIIYPILWQLSWGNWWLTSGFGVFGNRQLWAPAEPQATTPAESRGAFGEVVTSIPTKMWVVSIMSICFHHHHHTHHIYIYAHVVSILVNVR